MAAMLWHRVAALAAPLLFAAPVWAQLDAEACFRLYYGAGPTRDLYRKWKEAGDKFAQADAAAIFESIGPGALAPAAFNDRVNEIHAQRGRCVPSRGAAGNSLNGPSGHRRRGWRTGTPRPLSIARRSSWATAEP